MEIRFTFLSYPLRDNFIKDIATIALRERLIHISAKMSTFLVDDFLSTYYCPSNSAVWENWDEILDRIWWRRKTSLKLAVWENSESAAAVLAIPILYCFSLLCFTLCDSHPLFDFTTSQRVSCQEQSRLQRSQTVKGLKVKQANKIIGQTKERFCLANFLLDSR